VTPPLIEMTGVVKSGPGLGPLRVEHLAVHRGDRIVIAGLDATAAEVLLNLITGAAVADEGTVRVAGADTKAIATDTEWLRSLDRFGIVTDRAVLVGALSVASNLALPLTLSIEPMADEIREKVGRLAADVGLPPERLRDAAGTLDVHERARAHLARAIANNPEVLLLEHPTANFTAAAASRELGATLARLGGVRGLGWVALSNDDEFARASGARRLRLDAATGRVRGAGGFWRSLFDRKLT
jgi:predicted ABC-type transport system involved in lysophospholipase L1 biosynthesis ATPase subunit